MNNITNKFLLVGDKLAEMHLTQPRFTNSACEPFTKNKAIGDSRYIYKNELGKACFKHDMLYGDFKHLPRRAASCKYYMIKHSKLLVTQSKMDVNVDLNPWSTKLFLSELETLRLIQEKESLITNK